MNEIQTIKCKAVFVSDIHLGTTDSQCDVFMEFLKHIECEMLYLVGDIVDGWELKRKFRWTQGHSNVLQKLLKKGRKGTQIIYILGNHDEFLRPFLPLGLGDNVTICDHTLHCAINGKDYLVIHGDLFDTITMTKKWLALLGDKSYLFLLKINKPLNLIRKFFGLYTYWSISKFAKRHVKKAVSYICDYEEILCAHAKEQHVDGVICGHIHEPVIKKIENIEYINCGDWVENCSAIIEHYTGEFELVSYSPSHHIYKEKQNDNT